MSGIHVVYLVLALIFACFITYMFVYNIKLKTRQKTMALKGRPPASKEEGIAVATMDKEQSHQSGSLS